MNIALLLQRTALAQPAAPALLRGAVPVLDYLGLRRRVIGTAAWLRARGVERGDRVALFLPNHLEYLEWLLATLWIGATVVPVNFKLHPRELDHVLCDSGAALLVTSTATSGEELTWRGDRVDIESAPQRPEASGSLMEPMPCEPDEVAWLFYTSGTTGRPKGVMITHRNLMAMTLAYFASVDRIEAADAMLYAAPMSHGAGLYAFPALLAGARHVVPASGGFDAAEILELGRSVGRICMFAAPTMVRRLVDAVERQPVGLEGIKTVVYGGGPMYVADIRRALRVMGERFVQIYGQGESPMTITALSRADLVDAERRGCEARLVSVGRAQAPVEVVVRDAQGEPLPPGKAGEVTVRGDTVMRGYWCNPEATAKALRGGWLATGDIGSLSEDGYLTLLDRSKDMIISGGSNVYPREVEEVLLSAPGVAEVSVIGAPDPEWGEIVVACVVPEPGVSLQEDALDRHCLQAIARFKRPRVYRFLPALPKNHYGKVLKTELRERFATASPQRGAEHAAG